MSDSAILRRKLSKCRLCGTFGLHACEADDGRIRYGCMSKPDESDMVFARLQMLRPDVQEALRKLDP